MPEKMNIRRLGILLVALLAAALFLPWSGSMPRLVLGWTLAMLTIAYVVMGVRSSPPYDDQAFHRTLPPRDEAVFWRVLGMQLLLVAGFAVCIAVYCVVNHFAWHSLELGLAPLAGVFGLMSACGAVATLGMSREMERSKVLLIALVVPGVSLFLRIQYAMRIQYGPARFGLMRLDLTPWHYALLFVTMAVAYPAIWWLIAARRRRALGIGLMLAAGALLPWLYGDYLPHSWQLAAPVKIPAEQLPKAELVRKAVPEVAGNDELLVQDLFDVKGLENDEMLLCSGYPGPRMGARQLKAHGVQHFAPDEILGLAAYAVAGMVHGDLKAALADDGTVVWGRTAVLETLRRQLPPGMSLVEWDEAMNVPPRLQLTPVEFRDRMNWAGYMEELKSEPWTLDSRVMTFSRSKAFDLATGGTARMPGGGRITVHPLKQDGAGTVVAVDFTTDGYMNPEGRPDPPRRVTFEAGNYGVVADAQGKEAFVLPAGGPGGSDVFLGRRLEFRFPVGKPRAGADGQAAKASPELLRRVALLPRCQVYFFSAAQCGSKRQELKPVK